VSKGCLAENCRRKLLQAGWYRGRRSTLYQRQCWRLRHWPRLCLLPNYFG